MRSISGRSALSSIGRCGGRVNVDLAGAGLEAGGFDAGDGCDLVIV
jgi:hypothetical protein